MKRVWSLLLILGLFGGFRLPYETLQISVSPLQDSWSLIRSLEAQAENQAELQNRETLAEAYAARVDQMVLAVEQASDYVAGSLERHGDFFFWETLDGRANGYSPSLRARLHETAPRESLCSSVSVPAPLFSEAEENTSDSRDVGVFVPYSNSYYFYVDKAIAEGEKLAASTGGSLRIYTAENANVDTLAQAIQSSGILLINGHGQTDYEFGNDLVSKANSSYICLPTDEGITAEDQRVVQGPYGKYRHAFYAGSSDDFDEEYYLVDGTCIANHMTGSAPHSMVWLGFCLGMATEGMYQPLQEKGVEAMIGFSERVISSTDQDYRAVLGNSLLQNCTLGEAAAEMKAQIGCPDPVETNHPPAWPIAVSSQDPYPGRDHLTEGQEVLSTWKLHPAYPIQVTVEPAGAAEYRIIRTRLEISPNRGWNFSHWEITEGDAEIQRNQNTLDFTLTGPCSVTLHMEARTPASVSFSAGPGQSAPDILEFVGDQVILPQPEGELDADAFIYHFLGWSPEALSTDSLQPPELYKAGSHLTLTQTETLLRAVYGYFDPEDGTSLGQFRLVDQPPEDWAGDYVLSFQSNKVLRASRLFTGQSITSPSAVASPVSAGYYVDGEWLNEVPSEIVYSFQPLNNGTGTLKMKDSDNYLAVPSSSIMLSTVTDPNTSGAAWRMSWQEEGVRITNERFSSRILQYSPSSSGFCTLTTLRGPLTLFKAVAGEHRYTENPTKKQTEPVFRFDDVLDPNAFYYKPVYWAWSHKPQITAGTSASSFSPTQPCTRAQVVTFLWRAAGQPEPQTQSVPFTDTTEGSYYSIALNWALESGVTTGTAPGLFSPNLTCTRSQVVTFLWRAAGKPEPISQVIPFSDVKENSYYSKAVLWAIEQGITTGTGNGLFSPEEPCTRAQVVTFLYRKMNPAP